MSKTEDDGRVPEVKFGMMFETPYVVSYNFRDVGVEVTRLNLQESGTHIPNPV